MDNYSGPIYSWGAEKFWALGVSGVLRCTADWIGPFHHLHAQSYCWSLQMRVLRLWLHSIASNGQMTGQWWYIYYIYILELTLIVGSAGLLDPRFPRRVGLKAIEYIEWGPASEIYSLFFFEHIHRIMELELCCYLRFFLGASAEGLFPQAPAKGVS